jgi:hypothetical protein
MQDVKVHGGEEREDRREMCFLATVTSKAISKDGNIILNQFAMPRGKIEKKLRARCISSPISYPRILITQQASSIVCERGFEKE